MSLHHILSFTRTSPLPQKGQVAVHVVKDYSSRRPFALIQRGSFYMAALVQLGIW